MEKSRDDAPLYLQAKEYLLKRIRAMKPGDNRLEPENLLSEKLGMSRETVRKAMGSLMEEGSITRKHGKGNFGHPAVTNLTMRFDLNSDFKRLLGSRGYAVRSFRSAPRPAAPSPGMLARMEEARGARVLAFELDFTADGEHAIRGRVELLEAFVVSAPEPGEYFENMGGMIKDHCANESNHTTAWLMAENDAESAALFGLPANAPLLCWEEIYYNLYDEKMGYVKIWFNPKIMDLSILLSF